MLNLLFDCNLLPFNLSLIMLVLLSLAETIGFYIGARPSTFFKKISPKWLQHSPIIDVKFSKTLIIVFLLINFSFSGYFLQLSFFSKEATFVSPLYVIFPALIIALFFTVFMIHCLDQVIKPQLNHHKANLLGRLATISSGNARPSFSAQARVRDEFGQIHYIQVEPEFGELELQSKIILIRFKQTHYIAKKIANSNQLFTPKNLFLSDTKKH